MLDYLVGFHIMKSFDLVCVISRSASLSHVNGMLREQLDQATVANQSLTNDIQKLTQDWQRAREELEAKEAEWRDEEQVCRCGQPIKLCCRNLNSSINFKADFLRVCCLSLI